MMDFCMMDASRLGFKSNTFDKVVSVETLEHIPTDAVEDYFSEMSRVLKVGGSFICTTPQNEYGDIPIEPMHEKEYSLSEFEDMLGKHFVVQKIYGMRSGVYSDIREGEGMLAICAKPAL